MYKALKAKLETDFYSTRRELSPVVRDRLVDCLNRRELAELSVRLHKRIIVKRIERVDAVVRNTGTADTVTVFLINGILLVLMPSAYQAGVVCFVAFLVHLISLFLILHNDV